MKLREQKRLLVFLQMLERLMKKETFPERTDELLTLYTNEELRKIIHFHYSERWAEKELHQLVFTERAGLCDLVLSDYQLLLWSLDTLEKAMAQIPSDCQKDIDVYFKTTANELHYLASKPVESWDKYDKSNYRHLLIKTGTTKQVFGIYSSDVKAEDVYNVTSKPQRYFDTKEEALRGINSLMVLGKNAQYDFIVHCLWVLR